jgi:thioredoxin reductase
MAYRGSAMARFLSPITNKRTDKYGGSLENRARFANMLADGIKKRCGKDFIVHACFSGYEEEGGYTLEDAVEYAKLFTGHFDMLEIRGVSGDASQPPNYNLETTPFLNAASAIKKGAPGIGIIAVGGFQDLNLSEEVIASGKADFIGSARAWICNIDYGQLAYEGRNEDVVPCLRCNGCHLMSYYKPWNSYCAVNPVWGLEHKIDSMISPPQGKKKVAIIGGGPAGIQAALIASKRGHDVTLFEKSNHLGGNLKLIENVSFKWTHKNYNGYLERQIKKFGVSVRLNTEATPDDIRESGFHAVIAAIGAEAIIPDIPGIKQANVILAADVYGNEADLAKEVVIIGGGETGVEAGMHLAELGRSVTVLEMSNKLAKKSVPIHYYSMFREAWEKLPNFKWVLNARCSAISQDGVVYIDADGKEQSVNADIVVIAAGISPKTDSALKFYDSADRFYMVGDCKTVGGLQSAVRSAFSAAVRL